MAWFNRKKQTTDLPELKEYYATEHRERPVMAWVMALLSLLVTIAVLMGVFFLGRWIYRSLTNNDDNATTQTTTPQPNVVSEQGGEIPIVIETPTSSNVQGSNSTPPTPPATTGAATTTPATGESLPRTGPLEDL